MDAKQFMAANEADRSGPKHEPFSSNVDVLVRNCGSCVQFDHEDMHGNGWCNSFDRFTTCGKKCMFYSSNVNHYF